MGSIGIWVDFVLSALLQWISLQLEPYLELYGVGLGYKFELGLIYVLFFKKKKKHFIAPWIFLL